MKQQIILAIILILMLPVSMSELIVTYSNNQTTIDSDFLLSGYDIFRQFSLTSQNKVIDVCSCGVFADRLTIKNVGNVQDSYFITSNKKYLTISLDRVVLLPGQSIDLYNYIQPDCKEFDDEIIIRVESSTGNIREIRQQIISYTCDNLDITPVNTYINQSPCKTSVASFVLHNPQNFAETYYFDTNVLPEYAVFSLNPVVLPAKQKTTINLYYSPDCDVYGQYYGMIKVLTKKTKLKAEIPLLVNIKQEYDYDIIINEKNPVCNYLKNQVPVIIKNNNNFTNEIKLDLENKKYFNLNVDRVILGPYEAKTVYVNANPEWEVASPLVLRLNAISAYGDIEKNADVVFDIEECYRSSLIILDNNIKCSDDQIILFMLNNTGTHDDEFFTVELDAPEGFSINSPNYHINSGASSIFPVYMNVSDKKKTYDLDLDVTILNRSFIQEYEFDIKVKPKKECYDADINIPRIIRVSSNQTEIPFSITNAGFKEASYAIDYKGPSWSAIDKTFIELNPGESNTLNLISYPLDNDEDGSYNINLNLVELSGAQYEKRAKIYLNYKSTFDKINDYLIQSTFMLSILILIVLILLGIIINEIAHIMKSRSNNKKIRNSDDKDIPRPPRKKVFKRKKK